jgi:hypothetical protein
MSYKLTPDEMAEAMSDFLNSYNPKTQEFTECMKRKHRTLQQLFTSVCIEWLLECAKDEYRTDARNEASKLVSKKIKEAFELKEGYALQSRLEFI